MIYKMTVELPEENPSLTDLCWVIEVAARQVGRMSSLAAAHDLRLAVMDGRYVVEHGIDTSTIKRL